MTVHAAIVQCITCCNAQITAIGQRLHYDISIRFLIGVFTCCVSKHAPFVAGKETPDNLRIKINLSIGSTALVLLGSDNSTELLRAGLDGLKSIVHMYPETIEVLAAVQVSQQ